jgi:hypothetical protein
MREVQLEWIRLIGAVESSGSLSETEKALRRPKEILKDGVNICRSGRDVAALPRGTP